MSETPTEVPLSYRIVALMQERNRLFAYPIERLAIEIWSTRFRCESCGACCTRAVNPHIFLLDQDVEQVRAIDPAAYVPAPDPEFCDQYGTLYVSGYAIRMRDDPAGSCWFLENNRCRIYDSRFAGCRIYPHMLRRNITQSGTVSWNHFSHKGEQGQMDPTLSLEECLTRAREILEYENAYLGQQIAFLEAVHEYFTVHALRHDPVLLQPETERFRSGKPVTIRVFHAGELERYGTCR